MKIAIASGKGGTGKTTVSTNLARILSGKQQVQYLDCDVEEPNAHLFLHPQITNRYDACTLIPQIDEAVCDNCGKCSEFCYFNAIATLANTTLVFPELCHSCGGCLRVCPVNAMTEVRRPIGVIESGTADGIEFVHGRLNIGEAISLPLIRQVIDHAKPDRVVIMDAPPGTACPVVGTLQGADIAVLVAEPTAFGLHDLTLAIDLIREIAIPCGVFINRSDIGDDRVERFCAENDIPIWGRLPHDRRIAEAYSSGILAVDAIPEVAASFDGLAKGLLEGGNV